MSTTDPRQVRAAHVVSGMCWVGALCALPGLAWLIDPETTAIHAKAIPPDDDASDRDQHVVRSVQAWARIWESKAFVQVPDRHGQWAYVYTELHADGIDVLIWGAISITTAERLRPAPPTGPPESNGNGPANGKGSGNGAGPS